MFVEHVRRMAERAGGIVVDLHFSPLLSCTSLVVEVTFYADVVTWQTCAFEGHVAQAVRVHVSPSAPNSVCSYRRRRTPDSF